MKTGYIIFDAVQNEIIKNGNQGIASAAKTFLDLTEKEEKFVNDFRQNNKGWHCDLVVPWSGSSCPSKDRRAGNPYVRRHYNRER